MKYKFLLFLLFILNISAGFSQERGMEDEIEKIKAKGKEAIVQIAFDIIKQKKPALEILPEDYEITAWADRKEVIVKFRRLIRYVPKNTHYEYDLSVEIITKMVSPFDVWHYKADFFIPTQEQRETIAYLKDLIGLPYRYMNNNISEDDEYYIVSCTSETAFSHQYINKKTGEQLAPLEGTYAVLPHDFGPTLNDTETKEEDLLQEIKH